MKLMQLADGMMLIVGVISHGTSTIGGFTREGPSIVVIAVVIVGQPLIVTVVRTPFLSLRNNRIR